MNFIGHLTRAERIQRIGELLAKGVTLLLAHEAEDRQLAQTPPPVLPAAGTPIRIPEGNCESSSASLDSSDGAILDYLKRVRKASPRDIQTSLELSKATVFRRLKRLIHIKLVVGSGSTTAIRYRLVELPHGFQEETTTAGTLEKTAEVVN